jgi:hypothetical protein
MSVAEIKAEITQLSVNELEALRQTIEAELTKKQTSAPANMAEYLGSMRGTIILKPGWDDDDEPLEQWNAERDDTPL